MENWCETMSGHFWKWSDTLSDHFPKVIFVFAYTHAVHVQHTFVASKLACALYQFEVQLAALTWLHHHP